MHLRRMMAFMAATFICICLSTFGLNSQAPTQNIVCVFHLDEGHGLRSADATGNVPKGYWLYRWNYLDDVAPSVSPPDANQNQTPALRTFATPGEYEPLSQELRSYAHATGIYKLGLSGYNDT